LQCTTSKNNSRFIYCKHETMYALNAENILIWIDIFIMFLDFHSIKTVQVLGINFTLDPTEKENNNWHKIIAKIKTLINLHQDRKRTIFGKIQIINTLLSHK